MSATSSSASVSFLPRSLAIALSGTVPALHREGRRGALICGQSLRSSGGPGRWRPSAAGRDHGLSAWRDHQVAGACAGEGPLRRRRRLPQRRLHQGLKDAAKGFVPERKLDGMIVAFATRPGETAEDNSIYASALATILPTPGLEAEQVFKETQRKVANLSKGAQIPWTEDGLLTRFKFKEATPHNAQPSTTVQPQREMTEAAEAWDRTKDTADIAVLNAFIARYKNTFYAELARARAQELKKAAQDVVANATTDDPYKKGIADYYSGICYRARPYLDGPEDKARLWERGFRDAQRRDNDRVDRSYCFPAN